jgi:xylan 1,4-beta-xylosidase
MGISTHL